MSGKITMKAITVFLAVIMAAGVISLPFAANAADTVSLTVSSKTAAAGEDAVISINISANSKLAAATFLLKYDNTKLTVKNTAAGAAATGGLSSINENYITEGNFTTINDSFIIANVITAAGSMLNVTFTVKSGWSGSTPVTLTTSDFVGDNFEELAKTITNGSVTVPGSSTTEPATTAASATKPATTSATTKPATTAATTKPATTLASTTRPATTKPATSTTTKPATTAVISPATTKPVTTAITSTTKPGETTTSVPVTKPVKVETDELSQAVENAGITEWSGEIADLTPSQKEEVKNNLEENGKDVEVKDDGFYFIETVTATTGSNASTSGESTTKADGSDENNNSSRKTGYVILIITAGAVIAALAVLLMKKKK